MSGTRMNCERCGVSFHEDNLDECVICRRDVCYKCSVWVEKQNGNGKECRCHGCVGKEKQTAPAPVAGPG